MNGYIGLTDHSWYQFLLPRARELGEVNFWKPSAGEFKAIAPGSPFIFKLKAPYRAIAGYGIFARYVRLPIWLAWESFSQANGVDSRQELEKAIFSYRKLEPGTSSMTTEIGCIMISQPVFFERERWVAPPGEWGNSIVSGKTMDLDTQEGHRIMADCARSAADSGLDWIQQQWTATLQGAKYGSPILVQPRLGQGTFRSVVTQVYDRACAVTTEHSLPVLEAAHIVPYAQEGEHDIKNGILLRADIHKLFDAGYVTITPDYRFRVSSKLKDEFNNGKVYYAFQDRDVSVPADPRDRPAKEKLEWHNREVFMA